MAANEIGLRLVLGLLAGYHLAIGVLSLVSHERTARVLRAIYAITMDGDTQFRYAVKMLGLYAIAFGFLTTLAAWDPVRHRNVIIALVFLLTMRALCRLVLNGLVTHAFQVRTRRNVANATLLLVQAMLLVWWFP